MGNLGEVFSAFGEDWQDLSVMSAAVGDVTPLGVIKRVKHFDWGLVVCTIGQHDFAYGADNFFTRKVHRLTGRARYQGRKDGYNRARFTSEHGSEVGEPRVPRALAEVAETYRAAFAAGAEEFYADSISPGWTEWFAAHQIRLNEEGRDDAGPNGEWDGKEELS